MKFSDKKILVTGGAGFIGSNLCEELLKLGAEVVCFDNFSTGKMNNVKGFLKTQSLNSLKAILEIQRNAWMFVEE